tara:strand:+ start:122 stop:676 length:555 start_codon:yes stop_codon:yes gene_type:complete
MKQTDRILIFVIGFTIGSLLIYTYLRNKTIERDLTIERRIDDSMTSSHYKFPDALPSVFRTGVVLASGELLNSEKQREIIWILEYSDSYPFVRIVHNLDMSTLDIMAADQILLHLNDGVDVTELSSRLKELGLFVRMFNRSEGILVVSVLNMGLRGVPETIEALMHADSLIKIIQPDYIIERVP